MSDGSLRRVRRQAPGKDEAVNRLKEALVEAAAEATDGEIDPSTRFAEVVDLYLDEVEEEASLGHLAPETVRLYRSVLKNWAIPDLGKLHCREVIVTRCSKVVRSARKKKSYDTAKTLKAALSGACDYAVRHGAMSKNPIRDIGRLSRNGEKKKVVALDAEQRVDLLAKLRAYALTRQTDAQGRSLGPRGQLWFDLPDLMEVMLATGLRIGEALALLGTDIDTAEQTVSATHHIIRVAGDGLVRRPLRKGNEDELLLGVPGWSLPVLTRRSAAAGKGPIFASFKGGYLDPSNVIHRIEEAMNAVGYGWVTSHVFRKTVGTVLDEAGLPTTAIADQLGNSREVAERHYRKRRKANPQNVAALENMLPATV
ncbi:tyrosine-type recombinase/integrase [Amycolatopsis sp. La24]|uniref:site-specific integrase n=1 Tax=Amycolatopsis sp. La24 TaxID=3028304 RepID=UPI0023B11B9F|nr:tyrosine-type recombinase/integrase [Amycolatopsis sp. La24]